MTGGKTKHNRTMKYVVEYFWDEQYHNCIVETSDGPTAAKLLALDVAKSRHHYPYGEIKILSIW